MCLDGLVCVHDLMTHDLITQQEQLNAVYHLVHLIDINIKSMVSGRSRQTGNRQKQAEAGRSRQKQAEAGRQALGDRR